MKVLALSLGIRLAVSATVGPIVSRQTPSTAFKPSPGNFPKTGDDIYAGGIFCISLPDLATYLSSHPTSGPTDGGAGGTPLAVGPYPVGTFTDPELPKHTIYAPKTPPAGNLSMPFIAWGNGACTTDSSSYRQFLSMIASYGYVIAADGPGGSGSGPSAGQTMVVDMRNSLDWAFKGGAAKYGNVDLTRVSTAGHSCGGLEGMSTAYHDERVKQILMFDIAIFQDERRYLLKEINVPVAYFMGGPSDMGYPNANKDYKLLNDGLPSYKASLNTGHGGTYGSTNGGKFGKAAVAFLEWRWRNDTKFHSMLFEPDSAGSLVSDKWTVEYKNWK